jgi:hypothetical protein
MTETVGVSFIITIVIIFEFNENHEKSRKDSSHRAGLSLLR